MNLVKIVLLSLVITSTLFADEVLEEMQHHVVELPVHMSQLKHQRQESLFVAHPDYGWWHVTTTPKAGNSQFWMPANRARTYLGSGVSDDGYTFVAAGEQASVVVYVFYDHSPVPITRQTVTTLSIHWRPNKVWFEKRGKAVFVVWDDLDKDRNESRQAVEVRDKAADPAAPAG